MQKEKSFGIITVQSGENRKQYIYVGKHFATGCQNEIEGANFRTTNQYIPVNSYECYVKPLASWNSEIITSVLSLASDLIDNNHADRAEALLYNWFYDVTLEQIYDCVNHILLLLY